MSIEVERLRLGRRPFRITGYTFTTVPVAVTLLSCESANGGIGRGEAAGVYYLDDTPERIVRTLETHRGVIERGIDREQLQRILPAGGARNAVDCALWELEAQRAGEPVWKFADSLRRRRASRHSRWAPMMRPSSRAARSDSSRARTQTQTQRRDGGSGHRSRSCGARSAS